MAAAVKLNTINKIQRIIALTGSEYGKTTTKGSNGNLNMLCIKNTANEYLDITLTQL